MRQCYYILQQFLLHFALVLHFAAIITFCGVTDDPLLPVNLCLTSTHKHNYVTSLDSKLFVLVLRAASYFMQAQEVTH